MIEEVVILAAGKGKRMKEGQKDNELAHTPKPLLKVHGMPVIEHLLKKFVEYGIRIAIVINPNDEKIFKETLHGYEIDYYFQNDAKGTADALYVAKNFVKNDLFMVCMGDDLYEFDVDSVLRAKSPTIFGYVVDNLITYGAIKTDENGYAIEVLEKKVEGKGMANTGIYIMPKQFFQYFDEIPKNEKSGEYYLTDAVKIFYEKGMPFIAKPVDYWYPINTPQDLERVNKIDHRYLKIIPARINDLNRLIKLLGELSPIEDLDKDMGNYELYDILVKILHNPDHYMVVAEYHSEVIGTATLLLQQNLSHHGMPYGHIENVVVDSRFRNLDVGKMMMNHLVKIAKLKNCYKVILNCSESNANFYEKCGFKKTGEIEMRTNLQ